MLPDAYQLYHAAYGDCYEQEHSAVACMMLATIALSRACCANQVFDSMDMHEAAAGLLMEALSAALQTPDWFESGFAARVSFLHPA